MQSVRYRARETDEMKMRMDLALYTSPSPTNVHLRSVETARHCG